MSDNRTDDHTQQPAFTCGHRFAGAAAASVAPTSGAHALSSLTVRLWGDQIPILPRARGYFFHCQTAKRAKALVVTKETMTVEGMIKIVHELLKDRLNIAKITFTSGVNAGSEEYEPKLDIDRCPLCGITMVNGVCPKCGYRH